MARRRKSRNYDDDDFDPQQSRGQKGDVDLAANPRFAVRVMSNAVQLAAGAAGAHAGDIPWLRHALTRLEASVGALGTGTFAAILAALAQNPRFIKITMAELGVPVEIIALADEALDSFMHGLVHAHTYGGKITEQDEENVLTKARGKLEALERLISLREALTSLSLSDQSLFRQKAAELCALDASNEDRLERRLEMHGLARRQIIIVMALVKLPSAEWLDHLAMMCGKQKPVTASMVQSLLGTVKSTVESLDTSAKRLIAPPATGPDLFVENLAAFRRKLNRRTGQ